MVLEMVVTLFFKYMTKIYKFQYHLENKHLIVLLRYKLTHV